MTAAAIADLEHPSEVPGNEASRQPTWGLFDAMLGIPVVLSLAIISGIGIALSFDLASVAGSAIGLLFFQGAMLSWPLMVTKSKGNGLIRDLRVEFDGLTDAMGGVAFGFAMIMAASVVSGIVGELVTLADPTEASNTGALTNSSGTMWFWLMVGLTIIGAPIVEELFFRGLLLQALRRRFGSAVAVIGSTVAFTLPHYTGAGRDGSLVLFAVIGTIGLMLGTYVVKTGRLAPAMLAHATFNGVVVLATIGSTTG
ncbi:MAG: type II CAAX endopeptidase family protein [Acidimicrobiales bacterium]